MRTGHQAEPHERIYQMIWQYKRDGGDLWRGLRRRGKRYNKRGGKNAGRGLIPVDHVARKARLGDSEGDTVVSAEHKGGLLTLVERKPKIIKLPRATAHATQTAGVRRLKLIGDFAHTITVDNGKEFAAHIAHALKAKISLATLLSRMGGWLERKHQGSHPRLLPGADFYTIANPKVANSSVC
jgi:transposase, IS30 family